MNITIKEKTNPFQVQLTSDSPFAIDEYFQINDSDNHNPVCRIISSTANKTGGAIEYEAIAKIESAINKPVNPDSTVEKAKFKALKPFILKCEPQDGFLLGQVPGTETAKVPAAYNDILPMYDKNAETFVKQEGVPLIFPYKKMCESPHIGLFGGSGSGKTYALKVSIEELMKRSIPAIVLDPHLEMNFSGKFKDLPLKFENNFNGKFQIFTVGENVGIDFCDLNTNELIRIMSFSGELSGPMTALLTNIHKPGESFTSLEDKIDTLITAFDKKDNKEPLDPEENRLYILYGTKVSSTTVLTALNWRLTSLNASGIFTKNAKAIINSITNKKICVVRGSLDSLNIFTSYAVEKMYLMRRAYIDGKELGSEEDYFPPFFTCTDEAHLFCPKTDNSLCGQIFKTIAQEGRKYGVFEIFATQRPALLNSTIVAQLATKFIFRLGTKEDLDAVRKETDLTNEEIARLPFMDSGENYVSSSVFGKTIYNKFRVITTEAKTSKSPFEELELEKDTDVQSYIKEHLPINTLNIDKTIEDLQENTNSTLSIPELTQILEDMAEKGTVIKNKTVMGVNWLKPNCV